MFLLHAPLIAEKYTFLTAGSLKRQQSQPLLPVRPSVTLTICSTSVETICIQHIAVARAHTMVEMTLRAHTLKSSS